ncbi:hypothetical protein M1B72_03760 [Geomonas paludis]|uniref:Uncharacterized protein n=1 Tax=Geomonas paludis TaxID=2740185 RepID=A0A6V8N169_9BACT|nr:hypothetical protein [Geomonas paludis]UPU36836.1 hypothetical protein M1B72_03760 [Geomonas paludis]GFO65503.1 hypothetical protein GMPD_34220 [Geomonas paludis]
MKKRSSGILGVITAEVREQMQWRLPPSCDLADVAGRLADMTLRYGRAR